MAIAERRLRHRQLVDVEFLGLRVEPGKRHLKHVAEVETPFLVDVDLEAALRRLEPTALWDDVVDDLACLEIQLPDELGIEIRVPQVPLRVEDRVVR